MTFRLGFEEVEVPLLRTNQGALTYLIIAEHQCELVLILILILY